MLVQGSSRYHNSSQRQLFFVFMTYFFCVFESLQHISLVLSDFNTTSNSTELIYTNNDDVIIYHIQTVRTIQVTLLTPVTPGLRP